MRIPLIAAAVLMAAMSLASSRLAAQSPQDDSEKEIERYRQMLELAEPRILAFGGMFLLMVFLRYFIDEAKTLHWFRPLEKALSKAGKELDKEYDEKSGFKDLGPYAPDVFYETVDSGLKEDVKKWFGAAFWIRYRKKQPEKAFFEQIIDTLDPWRFQKLNQSRNKALGLVKEDWITHVNKAAAELYKKNTGKSVNDLPDEVFEDEY